MTNIKKINKFALTTIALIVVLFSMLFLLNNGQKADAMPELRNEIPSSPNFMATNNTVPFSFWQETISVGGQEMQETYSYKFEAVTEGAPMPEGSEDGTYYFDITGDSSHTFYIDYNEAGDWWYQAKMIIPDPRQEYYTYDETVYDIEVYAVWGADSELIITVLCFNPSKEKVAEPSWTIIYDCPGPGPGPQPEPTPWIPPQTLDANVIICIAVVGILLLCAILGIADKRKRRE